MVCLGGWLDYCGLRLGEVALPVARNGERGGGREWVVAGVVGVFRIGCGARRGGFLAGGKEWGT